MSGTLSAQAGVYFQNNFLVSNCFASRVTDQLCVDGCVSCCSITMGELYEQEKDEDGFLYMAYSGENTFGF